MVATVTTPALALVCLHLTQLQSAEACGVDMWFMFPIKRFKEENIEGEQAIVR